MAEGSDSKRLEELYELIENIKTAMLTTRRPDGRMVSRPMATQEREPIADIWFVTDVESHKMDELHHDPHVNLSFVSPVGEWASVAGSALL